MITIGICKCEIISNEKFAAYWTMSKILVTLKSPLAKPYHSIQKLHTSTAKAMKALTYKELIST